MSTVFRIVAIIYIIGLIVCWFNVIHGTYVTGGFQREHSATDWLLSVIVYGLGAAIWPAFIVLLIMGHLGALPARWEFSFVKLGLLALLFAAMAVGTWAVTHMNSPGKYVLHARLRNRLVPLIGSQLIELKTLIIALLVGLGSMLSLALL